MKKTKLLQKMAIAGAFLACFACALLVYAKRADLLSEDGHGLKPGNTADNEEETTGGSATPVPGIPDGIATPIPGIPDGPGSLVATGIPVVVETGEQIIPIDGIWGSIQGAGKSEIIGRMSEEGRTIVIAKKESGYEKASIELEEFHAERKIRLLISGVQEEIGAEQILRVSEGTLCQGMPPTPTPTPPEVPEPAEDEAVPADDGTSGDSGASEVLVPTGVAGDVPVPTGELTSIPTAVPTMSPEDPLYEWRFDPVKEIEMSTLQQEDGSFETEILITLDKTYVYQLYEDEWNYYISLIRPKDVYPKIVVIDAGHGGLDIGTYSAGFVHYEKTVCLNVLLYLKDLLDAQDDIKVYYTRTTDWKPSLMQRVDLANDVEADFFLSIHCNGSESRSLNGTEVLYSAAQNDWEGMNSKKFARICQDKLIACMGLRDRGLVPRDHNVTIIQQARMPVALAELAFMSNVSDMELLEKEETQRNIAKALYEALLEAYEKLEEIGMENKREE